MVTTRPPKTIVKPTALGPVANTDTKLLIYGLFSKGPSFGTGRDAHLREVEWKLCNIEPKDIGQHIRFNAMRNCRGLISSSLDEFPNS